MQRKPKEPPFESLYHGQPVGYINMKVQGRYFEALREYHDITKWGIIGQLLDNGRVDLAYRVSQDYDYF